MPDYSLITLNTWKCDGDYPRRLALIGRGLRALNPDVVALQEVFVSEDGRHDTAAAVGQALRLTPVVASARYHLREFDGGRCRSWSGMGLLSRLAIEACEPMVLPTHPRDGERVAQLAILRAGGARLLVANVHLTYLRAEHEVRIAQLASLLRHPWFEGDYAGVFICGDFNDTPDGPALSWLKSRQDWRATDCVEALHPELPRHSTVRCPADAGAEIGPNRDYVMRLARGGESGVELLDAGYVLDRPDPESGLYPSDHFGVRVSFRC